MPCLIETTRKRVRNACATCVAAEARRLLLEAGFEQLREADEWRVEPGGRYFFTRNMSSIFAFAVGEKYAFSLPQSCASWAVVAIHAHGDLGCSNCISTTAWSSREFAFVYTTEEEC